MPTTKTRAVTALLATAVAAAGLVTVVAPASAAPAAACSVATAMPARVSIDRALQEVPVTLRTTCDLEYADVFVVGPGEELWDAPYWEPAVDGAVYAWQVYGDNVPGGYRTEDFYVEPATDDVTTAYSRSVAKFGSKSGLTGTRAGSQVRLTACASYYNGRRDAFVPWSAHRATIQRLGADGRTWEYVKTVGTNTSGCAALAVTAPSAATYRVVTYETYQIFSRTSPSVRV